MEHRGGAGLKLDGGGLSYSSSLNLPGGHRETSRVVIGLSRDHEGQKYSRLAPFTDLGKRSRPGPFLEGLLVGDRLQA
ncbi:MAG: hypothetical protein JWN95_3472 [Frankiales bacterium]|nr:hypothetical protein [Frankiales bacterium]